MMPSVRFAEGNVHVPHDLSVYGVHQHLWTLFEGVSQEVRPFIWASTVDDVVRLRSKLSPTEQVLQSHTFTFENGQQWSFELRCNPTRAEPQGHGVASKRRSLTEEQDVLAWLGRQGALHGFALLDDAKVANRGAVCWWKGRHNCTVGCVDVTGEVEVRDPLLFGHAMLDGVGRSRAFGFGMIRLGGFPCNR